jgi:hypothetical protein
MKHPTAIDPAMQSCIKACEDCHRICLTMAMRYCLEMGGKHVAPEHFRLMLSCAEICQTSANFMLGASPMHRSTCRACADVCEACAESCEQLSGMEECAKMCRSCAKSCRAMAGGSE